MPQFDASTFPSQIFWLLICFFFLCITMVWHLVPRLTSALEGRERRLREDWERTQSLTREMDLLKTENRSRIKEAQEKAHTLFHQAMEEAHESKSARIKAMDNELAEKMKEIRARLEEDKQEIRKNMTQIVSDVVIATAPRLLGQPVIQSQTISLIQKILKEQGQA